MPIHTHDMAHRQTTDPTRYSIHYHNIDLRCVHEIWADRPSRPDQFTLSIEPMVCAMVKFIKVFKLRSFDVHSNAIKNDDGDNDDGAEC